MRQICVIINNRSLCKRNWEYSSNIDGCIRVPDTTVLLAKNGSFVKSALTNKTEQKLCGNSGIGQISYLIVKMLKFFMHIYTFAQQREYIIHIYSVGFEWQRKWRWRRKKKQHNKYIDKVLGKRKCFMLVYKIVYCWYKQLFFSVIVQVKFSGTRSLNGKEEKQHWTMNTKSDSYIIHNIKYQVLKIHQRNRSEPGEKIT